MIKMATTCWLAVSVRPLLHVIGVFVILRVAWADVAGADSPPVPSLPPDDVALVVISLNLEMARHYPQRGMLEWDYQKGNLNEETKRYTVEACRRVKAHGGVLHSFVVGQVFEQPDVDWMQGILQEGHPLGNHTYDHVRITATDPQDLQFRFQRSP